MNNIMQNMISNKESCNIREENGETIITLRPKAIDEFLKDKLSEADIASASEIINRQKKINNIKNNLCTGCQNTNCTNKNHCVISLPTGSTNANIMIINKIPTQYEICSSCCLSDSAGSFLSLILSKMNISRDDIYCTDMIKCNVQLNEQSFSECINTYLAQEINIVSPKVIICNSLPVLKACIKNNIFTNLADNVTYGNIYTANLQNGSIVKVTAIYDLDTVLSKTGDDYMKCKNELWNQILNAFKSS